jgi:putative Mn2+ efflux pump MntP
MSHLTIILLALALAMDAFAVSIASGIAIKDLRIKHSLIIASWFAYFRPLCPF